MTMNIKHKILTCSVFTAGLLTTPLAWSADDCVAQECGQMIAQLELLRNQVDASHSDIKKLETALTFVRQDIDALQSGNSRKPGSMTNANQLQRTGRGNRNRNAYPN